MKSFKEFGIKPTTKAFTGDKIKINKILNREIIVHDYKITDSKYEGKGKRLDLQLQLNETKHVVFTSSTGLMEAIQQVPKEGFPFKTTIVEENDRYEFS